MVVHVVWSDNFIEKIHESSLFLVKSNNVVRRVLLFNLLKRNIVRTDRCANRLEPGFACFLEKYPSFLHKGEVELTVLPILKISGLLYPYHYLSLCTGIKTIVIWWLLNPSVCHWNPETLIINYKVPEFIRHLRTRIVKYHFWKLTMPANINENMSFQATP